MNTTAVNRIEEMDQKYKFIDFPHERYTSTFSSTGIYWRPEGLKSEKKEESEPDSAKTGDEEQLKEMDEILKKLKATRIAGEGDGGLFTVR